MNQTQLVLEMKKIDCLFSLTFKIILWSEWLSFTNDFLSNKQNNYKVQKFSNYI